MTEQIRLTKEVLVKFKEDATKATQGEWRWNYRSSEVENKRFNFYVQSDDISNDGQHVSNACPQNFIALIDRVLEMEDMDGQQRHINWLSKRLVSLGEKLVRYEEALKFYASSRLP